MKDFIHRQLLKFVTWCARGIAKLVFPGSSRLVNSADYHSLRKVVRPGMVLLSRTDWEFSNLFIPGEFSHAAFCKDDLSVIESVTKYGVRDSDLIDFMLTKDRVVLLKPLFATEAEMAESVKIAESVAGSAYNFGMGVTDYSKNEEKIKTFFCSELITYAYQLVVKGDSPFKFRKILGVMTVAPSDFIAAKDKFEVIWDSDKVK